MALRRLLSCLLALSLLGAASPSLAEWPVPAALRAAVDGLEASQRAFVESGAPLLLLPEAQLRHELATRDAAGAAAFVASLMALADEMRYDASRDMGAIPLNLTTKEFNWGRVPTPRALRKGDREAGPFSVHRYLFPESGIPTFAGAPVAIDPEDLVAGSVDVAIIGVPSDMSSGRRGAAQAPHMMRAVNTIAVPDSQALIDPTQVLTIVDYGSFYVDQMSVERSVDHVTAMVAETAVCGMPAANPKKTKNSNTPTCPSISHNAAQASEMGSIICAATRRPVKRSTSWPDTSVPATAQAA